MDDGSKDDTGKIADAYAEKYPTIVRVIHQENGGHGEGVNQGIRNATGVYFKVVDSDDWLDDRRPGSKVLAELRAHLNDEQPLDLMMANYVYEHVADNTRNIVDYKGILPEGRVFTWERDRQVPAEQKHPDAQRHLPHRGAASQSAWCCPSTPSMWTTSLSTSRCLEVKTIYYMNLDLYRYFIGREDQSVNEANMIKRVDQQLRVTRIMMNAVRCLRPAAGAGQAACLHAELFLDDDGDLQHLPDAGRQQGGAGQAHASCGIDLKAHDGHLYRRCRFSVAEGCNLPGWLGSKISIGGYRIAQKLFKFN